MRSWSEEDLARAAGARVVRPAAVGEGPARVSVDTRTLAPGELFVGLRGERADGGEHAGEALARGAWGVLVEPAHAELLARQGAAGAVLVHPDPRAALAALAGAWREHLRARGARVIGITGSTGKTSTKDILSALLARSLATHASPANQNTEVGLPLALLSAPEDADAVVLEMAMRGRGQIAQLARIARPDVGVIVNVGPAHLELLGSLKEIAAAKAELLAGLQGGAAAVVPADEQLLAPHLRADLRTITFGPGGDVRLLGRRADGSVAIQAGGRTLELRPSFSSPHQLQNLLAAVAAACAIGLEPEGELEVSFSGGRGERVELAGGVTVIDDCYNANPMSMRAALEELAGEARAGGAGRHVAVLGDMLELGPGAPAMHRELGELAERTGVDVLIAVGPLAARAAEAFGTGARCVADAEAAAVLVLEELREGDTVLIKGSRGVGLERVVEALRERAAAAARAPAPAVHAGEA